MSLNFTKKWLKYLLEMDKNRVDMKTFDNKTELNRNVGRPRVNWLEDMKNISSEKMGRKDNEQNWMGASR